MADRGSLAQPAHKGSALLPEESLDPLDWPKARTLMHQAVDDMFNVMENVSDAQAWTPVPLEVQEAIRQPLPVEGEPLEDVYDEFKRLILPYPTGNTHPRFWGWVMANGTVEGLLADLLSSTMNCHVAGYDQAALHVERQIIEWLRAAMGFPETASGLLVSGGTVANLTGLVVARHVKAGFDVNAQGLQAVGAPSLRVYGSAETHNWIYKACELMGLGRESFRKIETDTERRVSVDGIRRAIEDDLRAGLKPFCIIGTAGTVNTAAIDDLMALRRLADEFGLWFHIDGAFGSLAALSAARNLVQGQELADSLAFDLHKWAYMQMEIGVALIRDAAVHRRAFASPVRTAPFYLSSAGAGISVDTTFFADLGIQLSRDFKALRAWFSFKSQGLARIGRIIDQNIAQVRHLADLIVANERLELLAPVSLNIACFRYRDEHFSDETLNRLNQEILVRLQLSGVAVPSHTWLDGRFAIRVCHTNHRTRRSDFDLLVSEVLRLGASLAASPPPKVPPPERQDDRRGLQ